MLSGVQKRIAVFISQWSRLESAKRTCAVFRTILSSDQESGQNRQKIIGCSNSNRQHEQKSPSELIKWGVNGQSNLVARYHACKLSELDCLTEVKKHTNYRVNVCKNACFFLVDGEDWGKSDTSCFISFRLNFLRRNCHRAGQNWSNSACPANVLPLRCFPFLTHVYITYAHRGVGSDLELRTKPPLRGGKRIFSALVFRIDNVIESKIIFVLQGTCTWIPRATVFSAPVRISMHMLGISLHKHPWTIRISATSSSNWDVLVPLTAILIDKCQDVRVLESSACVVGEIKAWREIARHSPVCRVVSDVDHCLVGYSIIIPVESCLVSRKVVIKRLSVVKILIS